MDAITPPSIKERPILFSGAMVRAILDGRKTQTRRILKLRGEDHHWKIFPDYRQVVKLYETGQGLQARFAHRLGTQEDGVEWVKCPYGKPGDRLWVRESWQKVEAYDGYGVCYRADEQILKITGVDEDGYGSPRLAWPLVELFDAADEEMPWKPSIHMPRWASRILLEVVSVRVERLQDISEDDAEAEGVLCDRIEKGEHIRLMPKFAFSELWSSINGPDSWNANPWVWVVEFKRVEVA